MACYNISRLQHLKTFETRSADVSTQYIASALTLTEDDDVIVCDVGTDSVCVMRGGTGSLLLELDTDPLDQPTCALQVTLKLKQKPTFHGYLVACRSSLKLFDSLGQPADVTLTSDVKCPSYLTKDAHGNVLVCDMLDSGSAIVTLHKRTLKPLNIFLGVTSLSMLHCDVTGLSVANDSACFMSAWYMCVTSNGDTVLTEREQHAVKAYTSSGEHLWTFESCDTHGLLFNPAGLTEDPFNHIVVVDNGHDRVLLLSQDGDCLAQILSQADDVISPVDVKFNKKRQLLVLLADGTIKTFDYVNKIFSHPNVSK